MAWPSPTTAAPPILLAPSARLYLDGARVLDLPDPLHPAQLGYFHQFWLAKAAPLPHLVTQA